MSKRGRILIVDDDPDFVQATRAVLRSEGYEADSAHAGSEAMASMRANQPDLVLLDVMMSWPLEGVSLSRDMMESPELCSVPIIMITSIRSSEYRGVFPQDHYLHINSWLDKPCAPETLLAEIDSVLTRHRESEHGHEKTN